MRLFICMSLICPNFWGCQFQLKVTILHIGLQPCPTFIRADKRALVHPKTIQQYRETKRIFRLQALVKPKNALGETSRKVTSHPKDLNLQPDPREPGGARLRSNAIWQERGCTCKITSLVFIELGLQHYPVGDFRSHAVPCWYSES